MRYAKLMVLVTIGCAGTDEPELELGGPLPTVTPFGMPGETRSVARPCSYDEVFDMPASTYGDGQHDVVHGRLSYDRAGHQIRDERLGPDGKLVQRYDLEYNAAGRLVLYTGTSPGWPTLVERFLYDASGRPIQLATNVDGDDVDDFVVTFGYTEGNLPTTRSRRVAHPNPPWLVGYDRTHHYDATGRLIAYEQDDGPDGTVDGLGEIIYDDEARTRTQREHSPAGAPRLELVETFDEYNRLVSWEQTTWDRADARRDFNDYHATYSGSRLVRIVETNAAPDDPEWPGTTRTTDYHEGRCH